MQLKRYGLIVLRWSWLLVLVLACAAFVSWYLVNRTQSPYGPWLVIIPVMLCGLAWGLGAIFGLEYLVDARRTNFTPQGLESMANAPLMGVLQPDPSNSGNLFVVFSSPRTPATESYLDLALNLLPSAHLADTTRTIVVCAAQPTIQTSIVSANLAAACALLGHRTLLIDADTSTPDLTRALNLSGQAGLAQALDDPSGRVPLYSVPLSPNLLVLPVGAQDSGGGAGISQQALQEVVNRSGVRGSIAIVAGPPISAYSPGLQIASAADEIMLLAVEGTTRRGAFRRAVSALQQTDANLAGVLLMRKAPAVATAPAPARQPETAGAPEPARPAASAAWPP